MTTQKEPDPSILKQSMENKESDSVVAIKQKISTAIKYAVSTGLFDQPLDQQPKDLTSDFEVRLDEVGNEESEVQNLYEQLMTTLTELFINKLKIVSAKYLNVDTNADVQKEIDTITNLTLSWEIILEQLMEFFEEKQAITEFSNALFQLRISKEDFAFVNSLVPPRFRANEELYFTMWDIQDLPLELQLRLLGLG